jgi:ADP-heptose:LPS heptosyltransferase
MKKSIFITPMIGMGDVLMTTPALKILKKSLPDYSITYCTLNKGIASLLKNNSDIDKIVHYDFFGAKKITELIRYIWEQTFRYSHTITFYPSNRIHYNVVSLLTGAPNRIGHQYLRMNFSQGNWLKNRTIKEIDTLHCVEENVKLLSFFNIAADMHSIPSMSITLDSSEIQAGALLKSKFSGNKYCIGVHAGTSILKGHVARRWPMEYFAKTVLKIPDAHFLLFGTKEELEANQYILDNTPKGQVTFVADKSIREVASVIKACDAFLSNDSGLMHLAAAVGTPVISLIGPTNPSYIRPWGVKHKVLTAKAPCSPCFVYSPKSLSCSQKSKFHCLHDLHVDTVVDAIREFMKDSDTV